MTRKSALALVLALAATAALPGCRSMSSRQSTGTGIGALLGAGAGYAIGKHNGHRGMGALAGAAVGAMGGYIVGSQGDDAERDRAEASGSYDRRYPRNRQVVERPVERTVYYSDDPPPCDPRW